MKDFIMNLQIARTSHIFIHFQNKVNWNGIQMSSPSNAYLPPTILGMEPKTDN